MAGNKDKEAFKHYHEQNPQIYKMFCKFAEQAARRRDHYSAKAIMERIRWETMISDDQPDFKIDNTWTSHYARKYMKDHPEHDGFFELRIKRGGYHEPPPPPPEITEQQSLLVHDMNGYGNAVNFNQNGNIGVSKC